VARDPAAWSYTVVEEAEGSFRVEVTDEDGVMLPVARQVSRGQADKLIERIAREARSERKPIKDVIRDPYFMAATVITIKRLAM
jgi:flagellar motor protein MotB